MTSRRGGRRSGREFGADAATPRYPRTARVNRVLLEVIAEELERLADIDERLRLVTITGVETDPDLRHATVWVGSLSDAATEGLADVRVKLQTAIGRQVRLKRTPALAFRADPAVSTGWRVEEVLRSLDLDAQPGRDD